jgi:DNA-binding NarL/FixJ family response regulator
MVDEVDRVAVDRAVSGDRPAKLRRGERLEAVRRLHAKGRSYNQIADVLGTSQRAVHRDLTDLGLIGGRG